MGPSLGVDLPRSSADIPLLEGSPTSLRGAATDLREVADGLDTAWEACNELGLIVDGATWQGEGFGVYRDKVDKNPKPSDIDNARGVMLTVAGTLDNLATGLADCQTRIDWCRTRIDALALPADGAIPEDVVPQVEAIKADVEAANDDYGNHLSTAANVFDDYTDRTIYAEPPPGLFERIGNIVGDAINFAVDFHLGVLEGITEMVKGMAGMVALAFQPTKWDDAVRSLSTIVNYAIDNPGAFLKTVGQAMVDWETLKENPGRWLGKLVPAIALAIATGGAGGAAVAMTRVAVVASRTSRLARVARRLDRGASVATRVDNRVNVFTNNPAGRYVAATAAHVTAPVTTRVQRVTDAVLRRGGSGGSGDDDGDDPITTADDGGDDDLTVDPEDALVLTAAASGAGGSDGGGGGGGDDGGGDTRSNPSTTGTGDPDPTTTGDPEPASADDPEPVNADDPEPSTGEPDPAATGEPEPANTGEPDTGDAEPASTGEPETSDTGEPEPASTGEPDPAATGEPEPADPGEPESSGTDGSAGDTAGDGEPEPASTGGADTGSAGEPDGADAGDSDGGDPGSGDTVTVADEGGTDTTDAGEPDAADTSDTSDTTTTTTEGTDPVDGGNSDAVGDGGSSDADVVTVADTDGGSPADGGPADPASTTAEPVSTDPASTTTDPVSGDSGTDAASTTGGDDTSVVTVADTTGSDDTTVVPATLSNADGADAPNTDDVGDTDTSGDDATVVSTIDRGRGTDTTTGTDGRGDSDSDSSSEPDPVDVVAAAHLATPGPAPASARPGRRRPRDRSPGRRDSSAPSTPSDGNRAPGRRSRDVAGTGDRTPTPVVARTARAGHHGDDDDASSETEPLAAAPTATPARAHSSSSSGRGRPDRDDDGGNEPSDETGGDDRSPSVSHADNTDTPEVPTGAGGPGGGRGDSGRGSGRGDDDPGDGQPDDDGNDNEPEDNQPGDDASGADRDGDLIAGLSDDEIREELRNLGVTDEEADSLVQRSRQLQQPSDNEVFRSIADGNPDVDERGDAIGDLYDVDDSDSGNPDPLDVDDSPDAIVQHPDLADVDGSLDELGRELEDSNGDGDNPPSGRNDEPSQQPDGHDSDRIGAIVDALDPDLLQRVQRHDLEALSQLVNEVGAADAAKVIHHLLRDGRISPPKSDDFGPGDSSPDQDEPLSLQDWVNDVGEDDDELMDFIDEVDPDLDELGRELEDSDDNDAGSDPGAGVMRGTGEGDFGEQEPTDDELDDIEANPSDLDGIDDGDLEALVDLDDLLAQRGQVDIEDVRQRLAEAGVDPTAADTAVRRLREIQNRRITDSSFGDIARENADLDELGNRLEDLYDVDGRRDRDGLAFFDDITSATDRHNRGPADPDQDPDSSADNNDPGDDDPSDDDDGTGTGTDGGPRGPGDDDSGDSQADDGEPEDDQPAIHQTGDEDEAGHDADTDAGAGAGEGSGHGDDQAPPGGGDDEWRPPEVDENGLSEAQRRLLDRGVTPGSVRPMGRQSNIGLTRGSGNKGTQLVDLDDGGSAIYKPKGEMAPEAGPWHIPEGGGPDREVATYETAEDMGCERGFAVSVPYDGELGEGSLTELVEGFDQEIDLDDIPRDQIEEIAVVHYVAGTMDSPTGLGTDADGRLASVDHKRTFPEVDPDGDPPDPPLHALNSPAVRHVINQPQPLRPELLRRLERIDIEAFRARRARRVGDQAADASVRRLQEIIREGRITGDAYPGPTPTGDDVDDLIAAFTDWDDPDSRGNADDGVSEADAHDDDGHDDGDAALVHDADDGWDDDDLDAGGDDDPGDDGDGIGPRSGPQGPGDGDGFDDATATDDGGDAGEANDIDLAGEDDPDRDADPDRSQPGDDNNDPEDNQPEDTSGDGVDDGPGDGGDVAERGRPDGRGRWEASLREQHMARQPARFERVDASSALARRLGISWGGNELHIAVYRDGRRGESYGLFKPTSGTSEAGNDLPEGSYAVNSVATSRTAEMLGFGDLVPPTARIDGPGGPGHVTAIARNPLGTGHDRPGPARSPEEYSQRDREGIAVIDYVCANPDRFGTNLGSSTGVDPDGGMNRPRPVAWDNDNTFADPGSEAIYSRFVNHQLRSDEPLSDRTLAQLDAVDIDDFRRMLHETGLDDRAVDGAADRLEEIRHNRRITGDAWRNQGGYITGDPSPPPPRKPVDGADGDLDRTDDRTDVEGPGDDDLDANDAAAAADDGPGDDGNPPSGQDDNPGDDENDGRTDVEGPGGDDGVRQGAGGGDGLGERFPWLGDINPWRGRDGEDNNCWSCAEAMIRRLRGQDDGVARRGRQQQSPRDLARRLGGRFDPVGNRPDEARSEVERRLRAAADDAAGGVDPDAGDPDEVVAHGVLMCVRTPPAPIHLVNVTVNRRGDVDFVDAQSAGRAVLDDRDYTRFRFMQVPDRADARDADLPDADPDPDDLAPAAGPREPDGSDDADGRTPRATPHATPLDPDGDDDHQDDIDDDPDQPSTRDPDDTPDQPDNHTPLDSEGDTPSDPGRSTPLDPEGNTPSDPNPRTKDATPLDPDGGTPRDPDGQTNEATPLDPDGGTPRDADRDGNAEANQADQADQAEVDDSSDADIDDAEVDDTLSSVRDSQLIREVELVRGRVVGMRGNHQSGANRTQIVTFDGARRRIFKPAAGERVRFRSIPAGRMHRREVASPRIAEMFNMGRYMPAATPWRRPDDFADQWPGDDEGSLAEWVEGTEPGLQDVREYERADREAMAVLDYVCGNLDRSRANFRTVRDRDAQPDGTASPPRRLGRHHNGDAGGVRRPLGVDHGLTLPTSNEVSLQSPFVFDRLGERLGDDLLATLRAVDIKEFRTMLRGSGIEDDAIDGAVDRLMEIRKDGMITGRAWNGHLTVELTTSNGPRKKVIKLPRRQDHRPAGTSPSADRGPNADTNTDPDDLRTDVEGDGDGGADHDADDGGTDHDIDGNGDFNDAGDQPDDGGHGDDDGPESRAGDGERRRWRPSLREQHMTRRPVRFVQVDAAPELSRRLGIGRAGDHLHIAVYRDGRRGESYGLFKSDADGAPTHTSDGIHSVATSRTAEMVGFGDLVPPHRPHRRARRPRPRHGHRPQPPRHRHRPGRPSTRPERVQPT